MTVNAIDSHRFGLVIVNGKRYSSDVIIFPDRVEDNWRRVKGHQLCPSDITEIILEKPEVLVVGTGIYGLMNVLPEVQQAADDKGIKLVAETTDKACDTYNRICSSQKVIAALHITC